jgi:thioredoxin 1
MSDLAVLTEDNFKDTTGSGVTLVDFWAEWCGPCRMVTPILEQMAPGYAGKATIAKCNVDDAPGLAQQFGVNSIPTLIVMKDGAEVKRFVGFTPKDDLSKALDAAIG